MNTDDTIFGFFGVGGGQSAFLDMLGVFTEFVTNLRRERQLEGIVKAKAAGASWIPDRV